MRGLAGVRPRQNANCPRPYKAMLAAHILGMGRVIHLSVFPSINVVRLRKASALGRALVQCKKCCCGRYEIASPAHSLCDACGCGVRHYALCAWSAKQPSSIGITEPSIATSLPQNGDPSGTRKWLYDHGVSYNFIYTNDVLSNLSGGIQRGTIDQGKLEAQLYIDLEKLAGWKDWTFYANAFGIYNDWPHPARLRRRHEHDCGDRSDADRTPVGIVARTLVWSRQFQIWPARRGRRILL